MLCSEEPALHWLMIVHPGIEDLATAINKERGWIRRFSSGVPTQSVEVRELISRIEKQLEMIREAFVRHEFSNSRWEIRCRARVYHHDLCSSLCETRSTLQELLHLPMQTGHR